MRKPVSYYSGGDYEEPSMTADEVHERSREPKWSGLYDQYGNKLYRYEERVPLGFHHRGGE